MTDSEDELGVIYALIERFEKQRLLSSCVDTTLEAQRSKRLIDRHPEWQEFCAEVIHFYEEIAEKALENEKKS